MNKKLIKQLEGVGFVKAKTTLNLKVKGGFICDFFMRNRMLIIYNSEKVSKKYVSCTFEEILSLIKEHTGVDLTKKTKREEIEELKTGLKALVEKAEDSEAVFDARLKGYFMSIVDTVQVQGGKIESLGDAIKSQNDVIEELNISKPLEVAKEIAKLALKIKAMELSKKFENGGAIATARSGENVFSKTPAPDMSDFKEMTDRMQKAFKESIKQEAEQQEKKAFEVGDRVVLIKKPEASWSDWFRTLAEKEIVLVIDKLDGKRAMLSDSDGLVYSDSFILSDLEHAPAESPKEKALLYGTSYRLGIISEAAVKQGYNEGDKVLYLGKGKGIGVARYIKEGCELRCTGKENLKPL